MFSAVMVIEGIVTFFKVLFSMTSDRGIFAMTQLLYNFQATSNSKGGFALSTPLTFPFILGILFSFDFHKYSTITTLTNNFNKSALIEKKLFAVMISHLFEPNAELNFCSHDAF